MKMEQIMAEIRAILKAGYEEIKAEKKGHQERTHFLNNRGRVFCMVSAKWL
jgi:hypothetical protein